MKLLKISWDEFTDIYPIFESREIEFALWHKETDSSFIFLFHKDFNIYCEVDKLDILDREDMLNVDLETVEQFWSDFRNRYLSHSRPFITYGGI